MLENIGRQIGRQPSDPILQEGIGQGWNCNRLQGRQSQRFLSYLVNGGQKRFSFFSAPEKFVKNVITTLKTVVRPHFFACLNVVAIMTGFFCILCVHPINSAPQEYRQKVGKSVPSRKARKNRKSRKRSRKARKLKLPSRKAQKFNQKIGRQIGRQIKRPSLCSGFLKAAFLACSGLLSLLWSSIQATSDLHMYPRSLYRHENNVLRLATMKAFQTSMRHHSGHNCLLLEAMGNLKPWLVSTLQHCQLGHINSLTSSFGDDFFLDSCEILVP